MRTDPASPAAMRWCILCGNSGRWDDGASCTCILGGILASFHRPVDPLDFTKIKDVNA